MPIYTPDEYLADPTRELSRWVMLDWNMPVEWPDGLSDEPSQEPAVEDEGEDRVDSRPRGGPGNGNPGPGRLI